MKTRWIILSSILIITLFVLPPEVHAAVAASEHSPGLQKLISVAKNTEEYILHASESYSRPILTIGVLAGAGLFLLGVLLSLFSRSFGEGVRNKALAIIGVTIIGYILISNAQAIANLVNTLVGGVID